MSRLKKSYICNLGIQILDTCDKEYIPFALSLNTIHQNQSNQLDNRGHLHMITRQKANKASDVYIHAYESPKCFYPIG